MKNIKHFIWDFDGTLFDTYPFFISSFQAALRDCGKETEKDEIYRHMMDSVPEAFNFYVKKYNLDERLYHHYQQYMKSESPETSLPYPFVLDICELIHKTGRFNYLYTHRGKSAHNFMQHHDMQRLFRETVTSEKGLKPKPDPEAVYYFIEKYGIKKEEALMIGDRNIDILCGKNARILTCYITNGKPDSKISADYCFESIEDLFKQLKQQQAD